MKRYSLIAAKWCTRVKRNKRNYSFGAYAEYKHIRLMCRLKNLPKSQKSIFSRYTLDEIMKWASDQSNNPFMKTVNGENNPLFCIKYGTITVNMKMTYKQLIDSILYMPPIQNNESQTKQEQENISREILKHFINQKYDHTL